MKTGAVLLALLVLAAPAQALSLDDVLDVLEGTLDRVLPVGDKPRAPADVPVVPPPTPPAPPAPVEALPATTMPEPAFDCSASPQGLLIHLHERSRADARILVWAWDFGDGAHIEAQTRSANPDGHAYDAPGTYTVRLSVLDAFGARAAYERTCTVLPLLAAPPSRPPQVLLSTPPEPAPWCGVAGAPLRGHGIDTATPTAPAPTLDPCDRHAPAPSVAYGPNGKPIGTARPALLGGGPALAADGHGPPRLHAATEPEASVEVHAAVAPVTAPPGLALTLGFASLALGGTIQGRRLLRWLLLAPLGLFTRVKDDDLLDHPVRTAIVQVVEAEPGIHYQALVRQVGRGNGVVEHHLRMLTHGGLVRQRNAGGYTCYFLAATDRRLMDAHVVLKADVARRILDRLVADTGRPVGQIAKDIGVTTKAVSYHLRRFEDAGLVTLRREGRTTLAHAEPLAFAAAGAA